MTSKEAYGLKSKVLKNGYGEYYKKWRDCDCDDRAIFLSIYEMLMEAYKDMENIENNSIRVAFNRYADEQKNILDRIVERFKNR